MPAQDKPDVLPTYEEVTKGICDAEGSERSNLVNGFLIGFGVIFPAMLTFLLFFYSAQVTQYREILTMAVKTGFPVHACGLGGYNFCVGLDANPTAISDLLVSSTDPGVLVPRNLDLNTFDQQPPTESSGNVQIGVEDGTIGQDIAAGSGIEQYTTRDKIVIIICVVGTIFMAGVGWFLAFYRKTKPTTLDLEKDWVDPMWGGPDMTQYQDEEAARRRSSFLKGKEKARETPTARYYVPLEDTSEHSFKRTTPRDANLGEPGPSAPKKIYISDIRKRMMEHGN